LGISKTIIFELDLENSGPKNVTDLDLSFRLATKKDIDVMDKENYDYDKCAKQYLINRLEKGDKCILTLQDNKIIGYLWMMSNFMELTQLKHISLSKNRAYSYKEFVLKEFRGKRVHGTMYDHLIDMLKKDGKRFVVSTVDADNKSSLKTRRRGGFKIIGNIIRIRFFGLKYDYIKKKDLFYLQNQ
jgi:ribosomal protein S18 acetylase RimI-like enzyme